MAHFWLFSILTSGDRNIACGDLGYQLDRGQMRKVIPADPFNRDDGAAIILSE
ncbi:hypothetical protein EM6_3312 (plasmid) [Asticcacaulis excentricus]|uniref:Uncharacterized protein n=1 Tax=Asticcacaulis excentricus TaxID=78587 RepID=A0A3G9G9U0_9CAUL|nr:hypothetical protein EM6_3312 [Asticcacaulis excentricus]